MSDPTAAEIVAALASGGIASQLRTLAYFAIFGASLVTIIVRFPYRAAFARLVGRPPVRARLILLALPYAAFALYHTWRLILRFFVAHTQKYAYHPDPPNLFVEAYVEVSDSAVGWWWSQTLLCWVVAACPLVQRAAVQRGLGPWLVLAHVVAAFAGAVSLAFPLLFAQLLLAPPPPPHPHPPGRAAPRHVAPWVWPACSLVSLASVLAVRASVGGPRVVFIAALAAVHVLLVAPFALACRAPPPPAGRPVLPPPPSRAAFLFFVLGLLCWAAHIHASGDAFHALLKLVRRPTMSDASGAKEANDAETASFLLSALFQAARRNDCQLSIAIDAALAAVAGSAYVLCAASPRWSSGMVLFLVWVSPATGPAATLALWAAGEAMWGADVAAAPAAKAKKKAG